MSKTILVIDDDPTVLHLLEKKLSQAGEYHVLSARDGTSGLNTALARQPDVILLDVMMPDKSGGQVARELAARDETKKIPVIFISVLLDSAGKKRIEINDHEYRAVSKPIYLPALLSQVRRALNEASG